MKHPPPPGVAPGEFQKKLFRPQDDDINDPNLTDPRCDE